MYTSLSTDIHQEVVDFKWGETRFDPTPTDLSPTPYLDPVFRVGRIVLLGDFFVGFVGGLL